MPHEPTSPNPLADTPLQRRRLYALLVLSGLFLGTLAMLNILGISRFIVLFSYTPATPDADPVWAWGQWGAVSFALAVGVLPYPLTFLCTDLISEFYGRRTANFIVWVGLILNLWLIFILWLGGILPAVPPVDPVTGLPDPDSYDYAFYYIRKLSFGAVAASMIAYLFAQFVDVQLFHFWKRLTQGKALWLRNNASTLVSQFVDTFAVITITHFYAAALPIDPDRAIWPQLWLFILTGYVFKAVVALLDTPLIYAAVAVLKRYLQIDPVGEHTASSGV
ncbi:MAG: queuosine precursor transporter [Planctomycetota bacterium]